MDDFTKLGVVLAKAGSATKEELEQMREAFVPEGITEATGGTMRKFTPEDGPRIKIQGVEDAMGVLYGEAANGCTGAAAALALSGAIFLLSDTMHAAGLRIATAIENNNKLESERDCAHDLYVNERNKRQDIEKRLYDR